MNKIKVSDSKYMKISNEKNSYVSDTIAKYEKINMDSKYEIYASKYGSDKNIKKQT